MTSDLERNAFVGRASAVGSLTSLLRRSDSPIPKLRIVSISGPGGIGKSFLVQHVERSTDLVKTEQYLKLELRGAGAPRSTARLITTDLPQSLGSTVDTAKQFPRTLRLRNVLAKIDEIAREQLEGAESEFGEWATALFNLGVGAMSLHKDTRGLAKVLGAIDDKKVERFAKVIERAFQSEVGPRSWLPGARERNRVRANVVGHLADALFADLLGLIDGLRLRRLLLLLDDYESLEPVLGTFLLDALMPKLRDAPFETTVLVVGRDRVRDSGGTHGAGASWKQHYAANLAPDIELKHLSQEESTSLIRSRLGAAVDDAVVHRIIRDTEGYPYLLDSEIEDALSGGGTALSLRNFMERTTRWMSAEQREWLSVLSFLDVVNEDAIAVVLPGASPEAVLDWFEREASIRSPHTQRYAVLPIIRSRVMAYVENRSPSKFRRLQQAAEQARQAAGSAPGASAGEAL